jgi:DNA polymerase III epsilon subunit-like protein
VATYNAAFDRKMLQQTLAWNRIEWLEEDTRFFCIMELYARFYGARRRGASGYRWHSLDEAAAHLELPIPHRHRATDDALLARAVLHRMAELEP